MTRRPGLGERHPRVLAGLWFGAFFTLTQLVLELVVRLAMSRYGKVASSPLPAALTYGILMLTGTCAGAWLGSGLLDPQVDTEDVTRRGAWIGIMTGIGATLLGGAMAWRAPLGTREGIPLWASPVATVFRALFRAGLLLPLGVLAGSCLVRANRRGRRGAEGA